MNKVDKSQINRLRKFIPYVFLFSITLITQNIYLNIETIEWDIASYLIATQDIKSGLLPNETQWESKGPVFIYLYFLLSNFAKGSLVTFKLLNDVILFFTSVFLFELLLKKLDNKIISISGSTLFLLLMSQSWALSGYSELYALFFISLAILIITKFRYSNPHYFYVGISLSIATLINQGTAIFIIPILISEYILNNKKNYFLKIVIMSAGILIPHIVFLIVYSINNLLDIYFATFLTIPFAYIQAQYANVYELTVFFRELAEINFYVYLSIITLVLLSLSNLITSSYLKYKNEFFDLYNQLIFFSLIFYFVGSHNYYHHLIFLLFFIQFLLFKFLNNKQKFFFSVVVLFGLLSNLNTSMEKSLNNLNNLSYIQNEYPLYNLSKEIDSYFQGDYDVLAFDYNLILYYLDKKNYSYIVHPSNHYEEDIIQVLKNLGKLEENYIEKLIDSEPDVIICNPRMIIRGEPVQLNKLFNCEVSDYKKNYIKLDTRKYLIDKNLNYYFDPYKEISVFVKR
jgi:hypothetical protein|tara:strand:+ start:1615 stop:3153 length:1539 start_codon:yes stop_codon:yes gene_type:complete